jgi:hypothetical protein
LASIEFVPLTPELAASIVDHPNFVDHGLDIDIDIDEWRSQIDRAIVATAAVKDGRCLAAAGITPLWPGRAVAWSMFDVACGPDDMPTIHRRAKAEMIAAISKNDLSRIESQTPSDYDAGKRWLLLLGMVFEGRMRKFRDGRDYDLYAWTT